MPDNSHSTGIDAAVLPLFATIQRWIEISGIGRRATYDLLAVGKLRAVKRGRSTLMDVPFGIAYLRSLPEAKIRLSPQASRRLNARAADPSQS
jgi:hypothetical protein